MKILVTGGAGYKGIPLVQSLLEQGHKVTIVDNFMFGYEPVFHILSHPNLEIIKTDVRNEDKSYIRDKDAIFHLAAISGYPECDANPNSAILINFETTKQIAEQLGKDQLLIFASTTSLYGATGAMSDEESEVSPVSLYGVTKRKAEQAVLQRENSICLRWPTVFGVSPRMRAGLIVNDFVCKAFHDGSVVLYSGESKRTFMHIKDTVNGYVFALDHADQMRGQIFNMGSEALNYSKREIAENIRRHITFEIIDSQIGDKDVRHFYVSYAKCQALDYKCQYTLEDGIRELIKLYRFYNPNSFIKTI